MKTDQQGVLFPPVNEKLLSLKACVRGQTAGVMWEKRELTEKISFGAFLAGVDRVRG